MRDQGRKPPLGTKVSVSGRPKSKRIERTDTQAHASHLRQWAHYVKACRSSGIEPHGVPPYVMHELEQLKLI